MREWSRVGDTPQAAVMARPSPATGLSPCDAGRLLICDDERPIVSLFRAILGPALSGVSLDTAGNGAEALAAFQTGRHGVLLMDLHMPVMDGYTAFRRVGEMCRARAWEEPAFVFCTGFAPPEALRAILASGTRHALLCKPVHPETLISTIRSRLG